MEKVSGMKIVIPGGSGQVGALLAQAFHADGHEVVVLSRTVTEAPWRVVGWDGKTLGAWASELDGADAVINLAGRSVNCRYTPENRRAILDSRVDSARVVGEAIGQAKRPPPVWIQAGTATIYAHRFDAGNDEATGIIGGDEPDAPDTWRFSIGVAKAWEEALNAAETSGTRKVILRSAMTMSLGDGGIFDVLLGLVRHGLGGAVAGGRQYVSWIHGEDFVSAVRLLMADDRFAGPVNVCSPHPLPYADFMCGLRRASGIKFGLPATREMLELGAWAMRTETELVLKSRRVVPGRLLNAGFTFAYPDWPEAASDLCGRWRAAKLRH